ncbi:choice-of-anchor D domain-containing protein [Ramlibacter alkalitolerans]|uniref:Choice-of-anchor D domain-containing protein n=1 Tax=Ramlibacter alkalitolerans TaxID=2039631 RepID=A0ABS1JUX7_9BURK|nr:choice-of-anchor D domain-containing protein [Ramlibacter alkalitolerans]MBL0427681.1 choice-of-anchor D domain-containing protein [Ramlibacter alkalitolerans]
MFSLIVTILSIALVAALALATLYYGGSVWNRAFTDIGANKTVNYASQVIGAAELFKAQRGVWPRDVRDLVPDYLSAAGADWTSVSPDTPQYALKSGESAKTCAAINQKYTGAAVIHEAADPNRTVQCFGSAGLFTVVAQVPGQGVLLTTATLRSAIGGTAKVLPGGGLVVDPDAPPVEPPVIEPPPAPQPSASITGDLSFGELNVLDETDTRVATLTNTGTVTLDLLGITLTTADYRVTSDCPSLLPAGASCAVSVTFDPNVAGERPDVLTVSATGMADQSLAVRGSAYANSAEFDAGALDFGATLFGTAAAPKTVSLTNTGDHPMTLGTPDVAGPFAVASTTCGTSLAAGSSCTFTVTYAPTVSDGASEPGTLAVSNKAGLSAIQLAGRGVDAAGYIMAEGAALFEQAQIPENSPTALATAVVPLDTGAPASLQARVGVWQAKDDVTPGAYRSTSAGGAVGCSTGQYMVTRVQRLNHLRQFVYDANPLGMVTSAGPATGSTAWLLIDQGCYAGTATVPGVNKTASTLSTSSAAPTVGTTVAGTWTTWGVGYTDLASTSVWTARNSYPYPGLAGARWFESNTVAASVCATINARLGFAAAPTIVEALTAGEGCYSPHNRYLMVFMK